MHDTIDFLKDLAGTGFVEINNLKKTMTLKEVYGKPEIYFCAGLKEKLDKRCNDDDFEKKKYFAVDIDVRECIYESDEVVIDDEKLHKIGDAILELLADYEPTYVVFSGNGFHLYYVGEEERTIDKQTYSDGVNYFYELVDNLIHPIGLHTDKACTNIGRIFRLPGSINSRTKQRGGKVIRDLEPTECKIIKRGEDRTVFSSIRQYAEEYKKKQKDLEKVKEITRTKYKSDDAIFEEINRIPAYEVAEFVRGVKLGRGGGDTFPLIEPHKNMGAYWYKPFNVIVNTGSSLIKSNDRKTFTTYQLVKYEHFNGDAKDTIDWFKERYGIEIKTKGTIPEKRIFDILGYVYGAPVFDPLECLMSGELCLLYSASNSGKTTLAMHMITANQELGRKCFYINLEFDIKTVARNTWLMNNNKTKKNLTDLDPLTNLEKIAMDNYVDRFLSKFQYHNNPEGMELDDLVDLIVEKAEEGYTFFVVDTLSRIKGTLVSAQKHSKQNETMEKLQAVTQNTGICLLMLHHTNKKGEMEGSQKIFDLSNVVLMLERDIDPMMQTSVSTITLSKDKFVNIKEIEFKYRNGNYLPLYDGK